MYSYLNTMCKVVTQQSLNSHPVIHSSHTQSQQSDTNSTELTQQLLKCHVAITQQAQIRHTSVTAIIQLHNSHTAVLHQSHCNYTVKQQSHTSHTVTLQLYSQVTVTQSCKRSLVLHFRVQGSGRPSPANLCQVYGPISCQFSNNSSFKAMKPYQRQGAGQAETFSIITT